MATIIDVAKEAGVSIATVSRVINNSMAVSGASKRKVQEAMVKVGYQSKEARSDADKKYILLVSAVYATDIVEGIVNQAEELGYQVFVVYKSNATLGVRSVMMNMLDVCEKMAGLILMDVNHDKNDIQAIQEHFPVVVVGEHACNGTYVVETNIQQAVVEVIDLFVKKGRKRIALIIKEDNMGLDMQLASEMKMGYIQGLMKYSYEFKEENIVQGEFSYSGGYESTMELLKRKERPDAILCISDSVASGCLRALYDNNVKVPDEISVCGFNGEEAYEWTVPRLTTVKQNMLEIGQEAVKTLDTLIQGAESKNSKIYIDHEILERETT